MKTKISGIGVYRPVTQVTAEDLRGLGQDVTNAPQKRYFASRDETSVMMSTASARVALKNAALEAGDIDHVLFFSGIPDFEVPKDSNLVLKELKATKATAWTLDTACASFISQMRCAEMLIQTGVHRHVMLINTMHWVNRAIDKNGGYSTLGDGSATVILSADPEGDGRSVLCAAEKAEPDFFDFIQLESPFVTAKPEKMRFSHDGRHARFFLRNATDSAAEMLDQAHIAAADVDWFVAHQTGIPMLTRWCNALKIPVEKNLHTYHETGNMSSVNIPYILHHYVYEQPLLRRGQKILFFAVGAGLHVAAMVFEY
jgi:3-oxoacyl-[acyl-carrier-protein] synthase-3